MSICICLCMVFLCLFVMKIGVVVKTWVGTFVFGVVETFGGVTNVVVGNRDEESKNELVEDGAQAVEGVGNV